MTDINTLVDDLDEYFLGTSSPDSHTLAEALWEKGWRKTTQQIEPEVTPLSEFKVDEFVQVLHRRIGDWTDGKIYSIQDGTIGVNTQFGPQSIRSNRMIRRKPEDA